MFAERRSALSALRSERPRSGELGAGGPGPLLLELHRDRATGLWEVYIDGRLHRLALRHGLPIHAFPGRRSWRLGEVLAALGLLRAAEGPRLERTLALVPGRSGRIAVEHGLIRPDDLERALREQLRLRAAEFLAETGGRYRFWAGPRHLADVPRQPARWQPRELLRAATAGESPADDLHPLLARLRDAADPAHALGLAPGASADAVRAAFRALALAHHPDRIAAAEGRERALLHRRIFEAAADAYRRALSPAGGAALPA